MIPGIFSRNVPGMYHALSTATVGIAGCGGLGSNAAVALVRAGIGHLIIADFDVVEESNLNRQYYFRSDVGVKKVRALSSHLLAINPDVRLSTCEKRLSPDTVRDVFLDADLLIEAFDSPDAKAWLCREWRSHFPERPLVSANGLSGMGRTEELRVHRRGTFHIVGDGVSDMSIGLCSARVAIAANMQANIAIELLMQSRARAATNKTVQDQRMS
jgi:sulfur carrier protein ThiS adenylyltransferase